MTRFDQVPEPSVGRRRLCDARSDLHGSQVAVVTPAPKGPAERPAPWNEHRHRWDVPGTGGTNTGTGGTFTGTGVGRTPEPAGPSLGPADTRRAALADTRRAALADTRRAALADTRRAALAVLATPVGKGAPAPARRPVRRRRAGGRAPAVRPAVTPAVAVGPDDQRRRRRSGQYLPARRDLHWHRDVHDHGRR